MDSITQHGAGALWIDGGRIAGESWGSRPAVRLTSKGKQGGGWGQTQWETRTGEYNVDPGKGRWPANLALTHTPRCQPLGTRQVRNGSGPASGPTAHKIGGQGGIFVAPDGHRESVPYYASPKGTETVLTWACADGCPVASLDGQVGERPGPWGTGQSQSVTLSGIHHSTARAIDNGLYHDGTHVSRFFFQANWALEVAEQLAHADPVRYEAKASRSERDQGLKGRNNHPTIKPISLCTWLAALLLPPAAYAPRRLLVPFCGTGSEMIGGVLAGFEKVLGIDDSAQYCEIATKRLEWWRTHDQPSLWPGATLEASRPAPKPVAPVQQDNTLSLFPNTGDEA